MVLGVRATVERMNDRLKSDQGLGDCSMQTYWELPMGDWLVALLSSVLGSTLRLETVVFS